MDAIVQRYKKLTVPVSKDVLDKFTEALEDECSERRVVSLCMCPSTVIFNAPVIQQSRKLEDWLSGKRTAEINSNRERRFRKCVCRSH